MTVLDQERAGAIGREGLALWASAFRRSRIPLSAGALSGEIMASARLARFDRSGNKHPSINMGEAAASCRMWSHCPNIGRSIASNMVVLSQSGNRGGPGDADNSAIAAVARKRISISAAPQRLRSHLVAIGACLLADRGKKNAEVGVRVPIRLV